MSLFFEEVLLLLRDGGVRFVVVGGTAVILHGVPRTTADLDLVVDTEPSNLRMLVSAMKRLGYRPRVPLDPDGLADPEQRRVWVDEKAMRALTRADRVDAGGLMLLIASVAALIQMKLAAGRAQDLADVDALRRLAGDST